MAAQPHQPQPRILLSAAGSHGDVLPVLSLAQALSRRGHEVHVIANEVFADHAGAMDLSFVANGDAASYRRAQAEAGEARGTDGIKLLGARVVETAERTLPLLASLVSPGRTLVVGTSLAWATRLVAETHQVPGMVLHLSPSWLRSEHQAPSLGPMGHLERAPRWLKRAMYRMIDRRWIDPAFTAPFNALRQQLGLRPVQRAFHHWIHEADRVLGLFPAWFAEPQPDWPANFVCTDFPLAEDGASRGLDPDVAAFLARGDAPVIVTAGTAGGRGLAFYEQAVRACQRAGRRGILLAQDQRQLPDSLPPDFLHVAYAPFSALLPRAAAIVHHGGIGTCSQAMRAGIAQLICPIGFDQFDNGSRVSRQGFGHVIPPHRLTEAAMAAALDQLSSPAIAGPAAGGATRLAPDSGILQCCEEIERMSVERHGR